MGHQKRRLNFTCESCGSEMLNKGDAFNPKYLVIECPVCGSAFLLAKTILRSKIEWEKLFSDDI